MSGLKLISYILLLIAVAFGAAYLTSRYLVSKLDGTGGVTAPQSDLTAFESAHLGLRFQYPNLYDATTTHQGSAEREWHTVVLLPAGYVPPQGGEGPPAITVQDIPNPEGLSLEQWIMSDARSNHKIDGTALASTTVGGEPALAYQHGGLYQSDATAAAHGGKIYIFEAGWLTAQDRIRTDFANLLDTVQFIP